MPAAVCSVPAAHAMCKVHEVWFVVLEYVSAGHGEHNRLVVAVPGVLTYSPATHVVHAVHEAALSITLCVPLTQRAQLRSVTVVPSP